MAPGRGGGTAHFLVRRCCRRGLMTHAPSEGSPGIPRVVVLRPGGMGGRSAARRGWRWWRLAGRPTAPGRAWTNSPSRPRNAASWRAAGAASRACSRCGWPSWRLRGTGGPPSRRRDSRRPPPGSGCSWRAAGRPCGAPRYGGRRGCGAATEPLCPAGPGPPQGAAGGGSGRAGTCWLRCRKCLNCESKGQRCGEACGGTERSVLEYDLRHPAGARNDPDGAQNDPNASLSLPSFSSAVPEAAGIGWVLPGFAVGLHTSLIPWPVGRALSDSSAGLLFPPGKSWQVRASSPVGLLEKKKAISAACALGDGAGCCEGTCIELVTPLVQLVHRGSSRSCVLVGGLAAVCAHIACWARQCEH